MIFGVMRNIKLLLIFLGLIGPASLVTAENLIGRVSVIDGDTLEMHGKRIRLYGIDAPESGQSCLDPEGESYRCGQTSANKMESYTFENLVTCEVTDTDRYGRLVAACFVDGEDVNRLLVSEGWALAYRRYSTDYVLAEEKAKRLGLGMWKGKFVEPWDWRRGERLHDATVLKTDDCLIKGNISSRGKIYHTPSSPWYDRTKINIAKGERWFCTEEEAQAAGWRAPN